MHRLFILFITIFLFSSYRTEARNIDQHLEYIDVKGLKNNYVTRLIQLHHIPVIPLVPWLRAYIPPDGLLTTIGKPFNILIVSDTPDRLDAFLLFIDLLDSEGFQACDDDTSKLNELSMRLSELENTAVPDSVQDDIKPLDNTNKYTITLSSLNAAYTVVLKPFLSMPSSLQISKDDNSISFDDTQQKYESINHLIQWIEDRDITEHVNMDNDETKLNRMRNKLYSLPDRVTAGCENRSNIYGSSNTIGTQFLPSDEQWERIRIGMSKADISKIIGSRHTKTDNMWEIARFAPTCGQYDRRADRYPSGRIFWLYFENNVLARKQRGFRTQKEVIELGECLDKQRKYNEGLHATNISCPPIRP